MSFFDILKEEFSSTWTLLNDTSTALSRAKLFLEYENDLRIMRTELRAHSKDPQKVAEVRDKVKALRTLLRQQGLELILGKKDIITKGWRHDDALDEGFRRCVMMVGEKHVYWIAGTINHIELYQNLEQSMQNANVKSWSEFHHLWYRWAQNVLIFSGSDSESSDAWERFIHIVEMKKNFLIKALKGMK